MSSKIGDEINIRLPERWNWVQLDDLKSNEKGAIISGPFGSNISSKYFVSEGIPVIRGNNLSLSLERFIDSGYVFVSEEKANELNTWALANDVIFTAAGTIGQVGIIGDNTKFPKYIISNKQIRVRLDSKKIIPLFAYYWLANPIMTQYIQQRNTGSTIPLINLSIVKSLPIPLPSLSEQEKIVSILSKLDEKIELNRQTNATLEAIAQSIFREWFVENKEVENWKMGKVGDVVRRIPVGKKYDFKTALPEGKVPILDQSHFTIIGYHNEKPGIDANVDNPVLVFSNHRCYTDVIHFPFSAIQNVLPFIGDGVDTRWLYHATDGIITYSEYKGHYPEFISKPLVIPPKDLTEEFGELVKPLHIKIMKNKEESHTLASLRDALLPKLMSGEIEVDNIVVNTEKK